MTKETTKKDSLQSQVKQLDELVKLWETQVTLGYATSIKNAFFFSVNTGLRMSDLRSLTWGMIVNGQDGWKLTKVQDKTGGIFSTPLNKMAVEILMPLFKMAPNELVFPEFQTGTSYSKYMSKWLKAAGILRPITFHTARHTFGTNAARLGANGLLITGLMGHTTQQMTSQYTQAAGNDARALVDRLPGMDFESNSKAGG